MALVSNWMHVDVFTVDQACALWCGYDPAGFGIFNDKFPSEVEAVKQLIIGGIVTSQIVSDSTRNVMHSIGNYSKTYVYSDSLKIRNISCHGSRLGFFWMNDSFGFSVRC